jgi:hypothetical protein
MNLRRGRTISRYGYSRYSRSDAWGYQTMDGDFLADQPGISLRHCYQQIHMDHGLMTLLNAT